MKKISIFTPCYNEEGNVYDLCMAVKKIMTEQLPNYKYEHVLSDNASTDHTWEILKSLAQKDKHIKIIENQRNFGPGRSGTYGFFQTTGDVSICLACDFQDPPELIPQFVKKWEEGYKVVWGQKTSSEESKAMYAVRSLYYKIIQLFSDIKQYDQITGFGLYDKEVVDWMRKAKEPNPNFRNLIAEYGYDVGFIEYAQPKRKAGKSSYNFFKYFNTAMDSLINTSTKPLKMTLWSGLLMVSISFVLVLILLLRKALNHPKLTDKNTSLFAAITFFSGFQITFLGIVSAYIGEILARIKNTPLVVEKYRINFEEDNNHDNVA